MDEPSAEPGMPGRAALNVEDADSRGKPRVGVIVRAAIALIVVFLVAQVGLRFLGGQVLELLRGTIEFGRAADGCAVSLESSRLDNGAPIRFAAHLERDVTAGERLLQTLRAGDGSEASDDVVAERPADCLTGELRAGLAPGRYELEITVEGEVLAVGTVTVIAAP